jgi:S-adenosyl-L-methionine hydrolase (adenosine-forming)
MTTVRDEQRSSAAPNGIVTLLTDFGTTDGYVAAMKGALLTVNPAATLVDVTHHIPSQDTTEAAFQLATVWSAFPPGTCHVIVVDPGVGSRRRAVAVEAGGHYFIAPDNGLLTLVAGVAPPSRAVVLDRNVWFRVEVSSTFHGRDLFAPVAGHLSTGQVAFNELGTLVAPESLQQLPWTPVLDRPGHAQAPVVSIDRFGNCRTLLTRRQLPGDPELVYVRCGGVSVRGVQRTYSDVPMGRTLALFGSHGGLELAVRGGSAAAAWDIKRGDDVLVLVDSAGGAG